MTIRNWIISISLLGGMVSLAWSQELPTNNPLLPGQVQPPSGTTLPSYGDRLEQIKQQTQAPSQRPGSEVSPPGTTPNPTVGNPPLLDPTAANQIPASIAEPQKEEVESEFDKRPKNRLEVNLPDEITSNVYGHHLYQRGAANFYQDQSLNPRADYIVATGDRFSVVAYGRNAYSNNLPVREDGTVYDPIIGKVSVGGKTYERARQLLADLYRRVVSSRSTVEVRLIANSRSITVNITGEVRYPGSYQIDASTPAFNALFAAGGVNDIGSVRIIEVKREGKTIETFDIYDYIIRGKDEPIYLQDNDFIYVPIQGKIAEVEGTVRRPMAYELRPDENLQSLVYYSGGLSFDAFTKTAQIARLTENVEVLIDFELDQYLGAERPDYPIRNGDKLIVKAVNKGALNTVQVFGEVQYPGTYQLRKGDRITDLLAQAGGLSIDAYRKRAYVIRLVPKSNELLYIPIELGKIYPEAQDTIFESATDNLDLQFFDLVRIFSRSDFQEERIIEVTGRVRKPSVVPVTPFMTLKDLFYLVGGLREDADFNNIELSTITRAEDLDEKTIEEEAEKTDDGPIAEEGVDVLPPDPLGIEPYAGNSDVFLEGDEESDGQAQEIINRISIDRNWEGDPALDTLKIYRFDRVKVYSKYDFIFFKYIDIEGSVVNPGNYQLKRGMTLKDALYMAGGLANDANENVVELYKDIDILERGNFDTRSLQKEIIRLKLDSTWQESAIADSIAIGDLYKIVVRSESDFFQRGQVVVKGLVNNPDTFTVSPNMNLQDLLYMAEGPMIEADFNRIELSRVVEVMDGTGQIVPIPITIKSIPISQNWQEDTSLLDIKIVAFDQVLVRRDPEFRLQESVFLAGEIMVPGEYHKAERDERLSSFVGRGGGVTDLAYLKGAVIKRPNEGIISLKLNRALRHPNSRLDVSLLEGDTLYIPPRVDVVTIAGNVLKPDTKVLFEPNRRKMKYYVNLAGGFDRRTKRKLNTVTYVDGRVKATRSFLIFRRYPKIEQGAVIEIAAKPPKPEKTIIQRFSVQEAIASATSILVFYALLQNAFGP